MITRYAVILKTAALMVPRERRADWFAEWSAELWHVRRDPEAAALRFCLGSFADAWWLRCHFATAPRSCAWRQSALACLYFLAASAAGTCACFYHLLARHPGPPFGYRFIEAYLIMVAGALIVMSATGSFSLGEYPAARRFRPWAFLALKFALILPAVFCGTFDLAWLTRHVVFQPHVMLIGYVVAFRWALRDQRRRCPVCLRLLDESAGIGTFSHNFLEWYGTELYCARGHGLLHVPEIATTYDTQRWLDLDHSWSELFS